MFGGQASPSSSASQTGSSTDSTRSQRQPDNTQVYVDSAGNRWERTTPSTDRNQQLFPPDPVTDFQKLTHSSTGETLPVFGRDLFQLAPSTFAPADEVPVTADYVIGPGDEILLRLWGADSISSNNQLTVDTSGNVYIPRVGAVQVAGLHAGELQDRISTEVNRIFRNYRIAVSLGHLRSIQVYVVGEARRPGAYTVSALSTVLNALFASGGPSIQGSMRHIQVRRGSRTITDFDLYDLVLRGDKSHDVRLETGDTIFIPSVGPQVALAGSVRHPAVYELKDVTTLKDVLSLAGGVSATADSGQVRLDRIDPDYKRQAVNLSLNQVGLTTQLHDGDVFYVGHVSRAYQQTVTIRGNLANPGRFAWKPGMRLSDILPDTGALLTNDYWRERNRLGVPTPLFEAAEFNTRPPAQGTGIDSVAVRSGQQTGARSSNNSARDALTSVQPPSTSGDSQQAVLATSGVVSTTTTDMDRTAESEAIRNAKNRSLQSASIDEDTQSQPRSQPKDQQQQESVTSAINVVRLPAPEIDWSYAVIERLDPVTLKSSLVPFNLGKLVRDRDPSQNLKLQPGDVVTILNQRDILVPQHEQTKYVRLEGEFSGAGIYSVAPGETLDQLIQRAGGFTDRAYLYGSSFQRESARVMQQQRLDEYITQLSTDMERETAVRGASSNTGVSDPNALTLERNLVSQLRALRATGRIVLEFKPDSAGLQSVPHIPLENGDVFRVPSRPDTVSVIGAVYGQNVFLYNPQRRLEDYLSLAGRPNRIADKKHAFIIRADGSIFSRERASGVLSNHFDDSHVYPGDAIVVPEKLIRPTFTRQLIDYSQILSSFGLAAAAIQVIK